jgi:hypothetical protein
MNGYGSIAPRAASMVLARLPFANEGGHERSLGRSSPAGIGNAGGDRFVPPAWAALTLARRSGKCFLSHVSRG